MWRELPLITYFYTNIRVKISLIFIDIDFCKNYNNLNVQRPPTNPALFGPT